MTIGSVTQKLRPLRIAFLVNPAKRVDVLKAVELSSVFWGGVFNPIVPCFKGRLPANWSRNNHLPARRPREITDGYIEGFDPDIIVPISDGLDDNYSVGNRDVATASELLGKMLRSGTPDIGIGAIELVHHLIDKEFKYVRREPASFVLPKFSKSDRLFLSSVFGAWPDDVFKVIEENMGERLGLSKPMCKIQGFEALLAPEFIFPRRVGMQDIEYNPSGACIYCLDSTSSLDVIDFWNLRAAGYYVIPAPKQGFSRK